MPITVKIKEDPKYQMTSKVGGIQLDYGVRGRELELELESATREFIRAMELQGMELVSIPNKPNPVWTYNDDGSPLAVYAIDWFDERQKRKGPDGKPIAKKRETSLDDSEGVVEYRVVGVFWVPEQAVEIVKSRLQIHREEREAKHPTQFGYGSKLSGGDRKE